jgi:hypothetical protein
MRHVLTIFGDEEDRAERRSRVILDREDERGQRLVQVLAGSRHLEDALLHVVEDSRTRVGRDVLEGKAHGPRRQREGLHGEHATVLRRRELVVPQLLRGLAPRHVADHRLAGHQHLTGEALIRLCPHAQILTKIAECGAKLHLPVFRFNHVQKPVRGIRQCCGMRHDFF